MFVGRKDSVSQTCRYFRGGWQLHAGGVLVSRAFSGLYNDFHCLSGAHELDAFGEFGEGNSVRDQG